MLNWFGFPPDVFFSISLALMVASLLETVFITNIQYSSSETRDVPHWLSVLVLQYLAVVVGLRQKENNSRTTIFLNPSATTGMSILFTDIMKVVRK